MLFVRDDERPSRSALEALLATFALVTLLLPRLGTGEPPSCPPALSASPPPCSPSRTDERSRWPRGWRAEPPQAQPRAEQTRMHSAWGHGVTTRRNEGPNGDTELGTALLTYLVSR
jgi:hypothetical protein